MTDQKICDLISSRIKITDSLLDVGCGEGYLCNCIAKKLQKKVIGLDISDKGFKKAHTETCKEFNTCNLIECSVGKVESLQNVVNGKKFDVVTFIHSYHHLDDLQKAMEQTREVLKRGGKIIIAEYSQEKGKEEDKCQRCTIEFIETMLTLHFAKVTVEQPEKGFFLLTAEV